MKKAIFKIQKEIDNLTIILDKKLKQTRSEGAIERIFLDIEGLQNAIVVLTEETNIDYKPQQIHPEIKSFYNIGDSICLGNDAEKYDGRTYKIISTVKLGLIAKIKSGKQIRYVDLIEKHAIKC